ncbi:MAG: multiprotein bridging factor aMBF1 [Candidatus Nanohaloarchaea archaeon]
MASCELCGEDQDSLTKIKTEGTKLKVCEDCSDVGKSVQSSSKTMKRSSRSSGRSSGGSGKTLAPDYGDRIKKAREREGLEQSELAENVNEKESRISKIERKKLKPDDKLGKKLAAELGVDLYVTPEVDNIRSETGSDDRSATLGDVAEVNDE